MATFRITRVWPGRTAYRAHLTADGQPAVDSALVAEHVEGQLYCSPVSCSAGGGPMCARDAAVLPVDGTAVTAAEALRALADRLKTEQEALRRRAKDKKADAERLVGTGIQDEALRGVAARLTAEQEDLERRALDMRAVIERVESAAAGRLSATG